MLRLMFLSTLCLLSLRTCSSNPYAHMKLADILVGVPSRSDIQPAKALQQQQQQQQQQGRAAAVSAAALATTAAAAGVATAAAAVAAAAAGPEAAAATTFSKALLVAL